MAKLTTAQRPFKMLVAHISNASDPSHGRNPTVVRSTYTQQHFPQIGRMSSTGDKDASERSPGLTTLQGLLSYTTPPVPVATQVTVQVLDNDFTEPAMLWLGGDVLVSNEDFTPGGNVNATATALAAAIDALPSFAAAAVGDTITIDGPVGPSGNMLRFEVSYAGSVENFALSDEGGFLVGGEPNIGPPEIT